MYSLHSHIRIKFAFSALVIITILLTVSACATNSITGRQQLMIVSEESAIMKSSSAYSSLIGGLSKTGKLSNDTDQIHRVKDITDRLITQAVKYRPETEKWLWSINVIDDPDTVNAFCMAGGKMAIYSGLIKQVEPTDDELAQVMGHEISHALARHTAEKMSVKLATELAVLTATAISDPENQNTVHDVSSIAALTLISLPNSRTAEAEADQIGIELAAKAGYDPRAAVSLWEKMMKVSGNASRFDFLSTHPSSPKRIDTLAGLEQTMLPIYEEGKLNRVDNPHPWSTVASNLEIPDSTAILPRVRYKSTAQRLREIFILKNDGVITESDFQKKKQELLDEY